MNLTKKQGQFLNNMITTWENDQTIEQETAVKLKNSFTIRRFDWKKLAKYSFWISIICVIIAAGSIVADDVLMKIFEALFSSSSILICIFFAGLAALIFFLGIRRRKKKPTKVFSNEAILFLGVLMTAVSVGYFGKAIDNGSGHYSLLFLIATIIYMILGLWFPSKLVWVFSLLSLGCWFGTETGYLSGHGAYFLGMNYPMRFVWFGVILIVVAFIFKRSDKLSFFHKPTYVIGLLNLFIALWIISIFGNYGNWHDWYRVKQINLFYWGLLFAAVAIAAIIYGLKKDDYTSRSFGIVFLFINLYTKYFEYFWDHSHKALFFIIMGISFWLIGRRAEKIWNLEFLQTKNKSKPNPEIEDAEHLGD